MSQDTTTIEIEIPTELRDKMDECADERGFRNRNHFVQKAIRDAVNAESDLTEEARKQVQKAREAYDEENGISIDEAWEKLDTDFNE
jgi:metal-responsive CopG/Arc/MetJ family transcriptional regulator